MSWIVLCNRLDVNTPPGAPARAAVRARASASLLAALIALACVSSAAMAQWGLGGARIALFSACLALLALLALSARERFSSRGRAVAIVALALLAAILATDARGAIDPLDYKIAMPAFALLIAPDLARALRRGPRASAILFTALGLYVAITFSLLALEGERLARGAGGMARFDVTGSLVAHACLCAVLGFAASVAAATVRTLRSRALWATLAAAAFSMMLLTATRTAALTLTLATALTIAVSARPSRALARSSAAGLLALVAIALHSALISPAFVNRLLDNREAFSSGRLESIGHWLARAGDSGLWGLGLGAVADALEDGRPMLPGGGLLEWPHNSFVRLYVEAGPFGFAYVALLIGAALHLALRAARRDPCPARRALTLAIAADMTAQSLLQNYFNSVYAATAFMLFLALIARETAPSAEERR